MNVQIGDTVKVFKWVYDTSYQTEGVVEKLNTDKIGRNLAKVNGDWYEIASDKCEIIKTAQTHTHAPQKTKQGLTLYICECGARQQKSKIVGGKKVEVWEMETEEEERARRHAIEMLETEGYGYDYNQHDALGQYDGGRGAGSLGQPID